LVQQVYDKNRVLIAPDTNSATIDAGPADPKVTQNTLSRFTISWEPVPGASGYRIFRIDGTQKTLLARVPATQTSAVLTNLRAGDTLNLRVEAYNAADAEFTTLDYKVPINPLVKPTLSKGAVTATSVVLNWTNNNGASGFRVYQIIGTRRRLLGTAGEAATSLTVKGLTPGTTVKFQVEAFFHGRNVLSNQVSAKLAQLKLTAPQVTTSVDPENASVVKFQWDVIEAAQGYRIYRLQGTRRTLVKSLKPSVTTHTLAGYPVGTRFVVQAFRGTLVRESRVVTV
jgi:hypothetical protein